LAIRLAEELSLAYARWLVAPFSLGVQLLDSEADKERMSLSEFAIPKAEDKHVSNWEAIEAAFAQDATESL